MLRKILALVGVVLTSTWIAAGDQIPAPANDVNGNPLPPGAIARIGTLRWRHEDVIRFAAFLPDGKSVVSVGDDQTIRVWEFPSGKELRRISVEREFKANPIPAGIEFFLSSGKFAVALSNDGKTIATFIDNFARGKKGTSSAIRLHDIATGKELPALKVAGLDVSSLAFSPNDEQLMSSDLDGTVRIWEWAKAKELRKFQVPSVGDVASKASRKSNVDTSAYAADGNTLIFLKGTNALQVVDTRTGKDIGGGVHTLPLNSVQFTSDGKQLITQADDNITNRWDATTGKDLGLIAKPPAKELPKALLALGQAVSPDGTIVANLQNAGLNGSALALTDIASGKEISSISRGRAIAGLDRPSLLFSPKNKLIAIANSGSGFGTKQEQQIELYDVATGKLLHTLIDATEVKRPALESLKSTQTSAFSADSQMVASSFGNKIVVWDSATGRLIAALTTPGSAPIRSMAFTPDGRCLALDANDGAVLLCELATAKPRHVFGKLVADRDGKAAARPPTLSSLNRMQTQAGSHINISPDGKSLAFASEDRKVHVWEVASGRELAAFEGHAGKVNAVAFSPDSKRLASASADTTALIWDISKLDRPALAAKALQPAELEQCWKALAEGDATKAFVGICDLTASPNEAVAFIKGRLKPSAPPDMAKIEALIAKLDDAQFKVRDQASAELTKIGEPIVTALDKALAGNLTLESKRRLEEMRNRLTSVVLQGDRLVAYRAVEVLERIGSPEAREVLQELANGAPGTLLTTSAQAALKR